MTKKRRHHTVPRFYLQRFANPKGRLVAYHREREQTMGMSVNDAGVEARFYVIEDEAGQPSEAVEEALATLEGAAKGAMDRVFPDAFPPDDNDREVLAAFLALQSVRTREFRHRYELLADLMSRVQLELQIGGKSPDEVREYMRDRLGEEPTEDAVRQVLDFRDNPEKFRVVPHPNESIQMIGSVVRATIPVLMDKAWHLCTSEERVFLTSDHPVALWREATEETRHLGVGVATSESGVISLGSAGFGSAAWSIIAAPPFEGRL